MEMSAIENKSTISRETAVVGAKVLGAAVGTFIISGLIPIITAIGAFVLFSDKDRSLMQEKNDLMETLRSTPHSLKGACDLAKKTFSFLKNSVVNFTHMTRTEKIVVAAKTAFVFLAATIIAPVTPLVAAAVTYFYAT